MNLHLTLMTFHWQGQGITPLARTEEHDMKYIIEQGH